MKHERVLMIADPHVDEDVATSLPGTTPGRTRRLEDRVACWSWCVSVAKRKRCGLIAVLGDIFDDRHAVTIPCLHAMSCMLHEAKAAGKEVLLLAGNHDSLLRHSGVNSIAPFDGLATVVDRPSTYDGMAVIPWAEPVAYVQSLRPFAGKYDTILSHVLTTGAVPRVKGVSPSVLDQFKHVFLGDVHDPDDRYVGGWMQLDYRDAGKRRGVKVFDRRTGQVEYVENTVSPRFHLFDTVEGFEESMGDFKPIDHVRVTVPVPANLFARVREKVATLECPPSTKDDYQSRSGIRADMPDQKLLKRYLRSVEKYTPSRMKRGLKILNTIT